MRDPEFNNIRNNALLAFFASALCICFVHMRSQMRWQYSEHTATLLKIAKVDNRTR